MVCCANGISWPVRGQHLRRQPRRPRKRRQQRKFCGCCMMGNLDFLTPSARGVIGITYRVPKKYRVFFTECEVFCVINYLFCVTSSRLDCVSSNIQDFEYYIESFRSQRRLQHRKAIKSSGREFFQAT